VHNREPTHRLVINLLRPTLAGAPVTELPQSSGEVSGTAAGLPRTPAELPKTNAEPFGAARELPRTNAEHPRTNAEPVRTGVEIARAAEASVSFAPLERRRGRLRRESAARQVPATRHVASLLDLHDGDAVVERTFTLYYDDEPVLTSTSYLPSALAASMTVPNVEVGQLALEDHPVTSVALWLRTRMPDPAEFERLAMVKGTPVQVLTHSVVVEDGHREVPAAVVVISRGDRVYVEIKLDGR
jgi:UTRA domain